MTEAEISEAAALLAGAWRTGTRIEALKTGPASLAQAHAIQDRMAAQLGETVGGFKANAPPGEPPVRGLIFASRIYQSPARIPASVVPDMGVEGEIAFRLKHDLPDRSTAYTREEVAAALAVLPAIEVVSGRLGNPQSRPWLEQMADCMANGALVTGTAIGDWSGLDITRLPVSARVNDAIVFDGQGGHPIGDPLAVALAVVNLERSAGGLKAGQVITTGSCTGLRPLGAGDCFALEFQGLGGVQLTFTAE